MQRMTAVLVGLAFAGSTGGVSAWHVHASHHDHLEHSHGVAAHEHHRPAPHSSGDDGLHACDPAQHVVAVAFGCLPSATDLWMDVDFGTAARPIPDFVPLCTVELVDARSHGPPPGSAVSERAPPACLTV